MDTAQLFRSLIQRLPRPLLDETLSFAITGLLEKDTSEATRLELVADLYQSYVASGGAPEVHRATGIPYPELFAELITDYINKWLDYHLDVTAENASWFIPVIPRLPPAVQIDLLRKIATADPECRKWVLDWDNTPMGLIRELRGN